MYSCKMVIFCTFHYCSMTCFMQIVGYSWLKLHFVQAHHTRNNKSSISVHVIYSLHLSITKLVFPCSIYVYLCYYHCVQTARVSIHSVAMMIYKVLYPPVHKQMPWDQQNSVKPQCFRDVSNVQSISH